jgi:hypothetical protein
MDDSSHGSQRSESIAAPGSLTARQDPQVQAPEASGTHVRAVACGYQPDHPVEMAEPDDTLQKLRSAGTCSRFTPFNANPAIIISRMFPIPRLKSIHAFTTSTNLVSGSRWIP